MIPLVAINQLAAVYRGRGKDEAYLDFAVADPTYADHILERLRGGITHEGVTFILDKYDATARKGTWHADTSEHGASLPASLDFSARSMLLPPTHPARAKIPGVDRRFLGFDPVQPPVADLLETVAEKLSRFRRTMLGRDVYDLAAVTRRVHVRLPLLREVLCFKAYFDRVEEGRDTLPVPFAGGTEFAGRDASRVVGADDLGLLARDRVDIQALLRIVEATDMRIGKPTGETETGLAACRFDDLHWARTRYAERARELRVAATA